MGIPYATFDWADEDVVRDRFAALAGSLSMERRSGAFAFGSLQEGRLLARNNAPMVAIRAMLPPERYDRLVGEVEALLEEFNSGSDRRVVVDLEYLLVLARKAVRY